MDVKDVFVLERIIDSCDDIIKTIQKHGNTWEDFDADLEYQYICAFLLIQIGEYVNELSVKFVHAHENIPWRNIVDMRNRLTHRYGESSNPFIWQTINEDIKPLRDFCKQQIAMQ